MKRRLKAIYEFYRDGFAEMTVGRKLWAIILLKLAIMFLILRPFFFPNRLKEDFNSDEERAAEVLRQLSRPSENPRQNRFSVTDTRLPDSGSSEHLRER